MAEIETTAAADERGKSILCLAKTAREIAELITLAEIYREDSAIHTAYGRIEGARVAAEKLAVDLAEMQVRLRAETMDFDRRLSHAALRRPEPSPAPETAAPYATAHVDGSMTCSTGDRCPHPSKCMIEQRCRRVSYGTMPETAAARDVLAELRKLSEVARKALDAIDDLVGESHGVTGLHRNGDVALWSELTAGGRYEAWLGCLDDLRSELDRADAGQGRDQSEGEER